MNKYINVFLKYKHLLLQLVVRDLKVKYRRSVLGLVWSVLNPLLMMLVITAVFENIFRFEIEYFSIYYLTGSLVFGFVAEATLGSTSSIVGSASLIKKVYIPKYIFPLEKCLFALVNAMFSMIAAVIVIVILQMPIHWTIILFPIPLIYALFFSIGLSLILATFNVFFRDTGHLYSVWITAWMYLTPIIYPLSILPEPIQKWMAFNPLFYFVDYFRQVVMYNTIPDLEYNLITFGISLVTLLVGLAVFKMKQDKFIQYI